MEKAYQEKISSLLSQRVQPVTSVQRNKAFLKKE